jgi:hypothetical protein
MTAADTSVGDLSRQHKVWQKGNLRDHSLSIFKTRHARANIFDDSCNILTQDEGIFVQVSA